MNISKELLSEVLGFKVCKILGENMGTLRYCIYPNKGDEPSEYVFSINIYELVHRCIIYAWDKRYEIIPRVMGAEIICLETGFQLHIIQRGDIKNPEKFDTRFTFKACQWILENK